MVDELSGWRNLWVPFIWLRQQLDAITRHLKQG